MLRFHRSERADALVGSLAGVLARPLGDPMDADVVAVPSRGVERWLTQRLAGVLGASPGRSDGVCANIEYPFPGGLVGQALSAASGVDPDTDPWSPERSVWVLFDVVDELVDEPWLAPLAGHLAAAGPSGETRRFAAVRHLADLYDRYGIHRPEMLQAWSAGEDRGTNAQNRWQAELWRRLARHIGVPSPAERLADACAALRRDPDLAGLPARCSLFGLTRLAPSYLDILGALAAEREVHLFLLHPSPVLWNALSGQRPRRGLRRAEDPTAESARNPLLGSWGRDAREMQLVLTGTDAPLADEHLAPAVGEPSTLLERIQHDVRHDRAPAGVPRQGQDDGRALLAEGDRSIQVHACHGRARQVEVLRDALLHLLADDADLEPRDVIVMCPDIETYAPLVDATFGTADAGADGEEQNLRQLPDLRVRLADRSLRQTNPVLAVVSELLTLATARLSATEVLDLADREPVRRRFGFDDDQLARLKEWVVSAGVRWGLDAGWRAAFQLDPLEANTWRSGLDRLLLGVAMAEDGEPLVGGILPLDEVDSGDIALAGRLAELIDRLDAALGALTGPKRVEEWAAAIAEAADALTATAVHDGWQRQQLQRLLEDLRDESTVGGAPSGAVLENGDVVALLADRLRGRPTRANFRTGHLTVCTLVPMRSVPHKVVCLLGLDDNVFPRVAERDGDDLILGDPCVGDRDPRSEDRQLLLDALMAAERHLVITYTGRDERTNLPRPPAVPVGELLDVIDRTVRTADGTPARARVVTRHPLQPFDVRNYAPGALLSGTPWSFDRIGLEGARASVAPRRPPAPFLPGPLDELDTAVIELDELSRFLRHPVKEFLRRRLGVRLGYREDDVDDAIPVELDGLQKWAVGDRMLTARLAGVSAERCREAERARGALPPGLLADRVLDEVGPKVEALVAQAAIGGTPDSLDVNVVLDDGTQVVGTVSGVHGEVIRQVTFSHLGPNQRLQSWLRLVALTRSRPERAFEALAVGCPRPKAPKESPVTVAHLGALGADAGTRRAVAEAGLAVLVDLYRRAMREPLPLYCKTSSAWAVCKPANRHRTASEAWTSKFQSPKENRDPEHVEVLGGEVPFEQLLREAPRPDEAGAGWDEAEDTRFGRLARRLWAPLLLHEDVHDR